MICTIIKYLQISQFDRRSVKSIEIVQLIITIYAEIIVYHELVIL